MCTQHRYTRIRIDVYTYMPRMHSDIYVRVKFHSALESTIASRPYAMKRRGGIVAKRLFFLPRMEMNDLRDEVVSEI